MRHFSSRRVGRVVVSEHDVHHRYRRVVPSCGGPRYRVPVMDKTCRTPTIKFIFIGQNLVLGDFLFASFCLYLRIFWGAKSSAFYELKYFRSATLFEPTGVLFSREPNRARVVGGLDLDGGVRRRVGDGQVVLACLCGGWCLNVSGSWCEQSRESGSWCLNGRERERREAQQSTRFRLGKTLEWCRCCPER